MIIPPLIALEDLEDHGRRFARRLISSKQDLETYERLAVEDHVHALFRNYAKFPMPEMNFSWAMEGGAITMPMLSMRSKGSHKQIIG